MADDNGREDFQVDGIYTGDRDMNNNGIPDRLEPGSAAYNADLHGTHVYRSPVRDSQAHLVAAYDVSDHYSRDAEQRRGVEAAERPATALETEIDSNIDNLTDQPSYRKAMQNLEVRRLQTPKRRKTTLKEELSKGRPPREDPKTGLEPAQEVLKGLLAGWRAAAQRHKERRLDEDTKKAEKLILENAVAEDLERARNRRDENAPAETPGSPTGGPSGPTSPESGPSGPDNGPGGPGDGPGGPGDGTSQPETATPATTPDNVVELNPRTDATPEVVPEPAQPNEVRPAARSAEANQDNQPAAERSEGRVTPADQQAPNVKPAADQKLEPNAPASEIDRGRAVGESGMGAAVSMVNPVAGITTTAIQTRETQKEAGATHAKGPTPTKSADATPGLRAGERTIASVPAPNQGSNIVEFKRPEPSRKGAMHAQAASLPRPPAPVMSKGPVTPPARTRVAGLGGPISGFIMNAVRAPESKGYNEGPDLLEMQHQKLRDAAGRGR